MEDLKLIQAKIHQANQIHQLIKRVLDVYQLYHLRPPGVDDDIDHLETEYLHNNGSFWVLVNNEGDVVGCCGLFKITDFTCELRKMYLDHKYQGKGYGTQMLLNVIQTARQKRYTRIVLKTNSNLKAAIALYKKYGFKPYLLFDGDQKQDCDVAMVLELENITKYVL